MSICDASVNCTDLTESKAIEVLPDIVGIGILAAFFITASAVFAAVILGYFRDFLPGDFLTILDRAFLKKWHWCSGCRQRNRATFDPLSESLTPSCQHDDPAIDGKRRKGLQAFVLSLSDQQMVIGPAMIIASLCQRCQISMYEFEIVSSLAWLASATHLVTLVVLKDYFRENPKVRNIRVVGMICSFALLVFTLVGSSPGEDYDSSASFQCLLDLGPGAFDWQGAAPALLFVFVSYAESISALYPANPDWHNHTRYRWLRVYCCKWKNAPRFTEDQFDNWYQKYVLQSPKQPGGAAEREYHWRNVIESRISSSRIYQQYQVLTAVLIDYPYSFLSELPPLMFSASYGITGVIMSRSNKPEVLNDENAVDFGQIVPLFLLLLPILATSEIYFDIYNYRYPLTENLGPKKPIYRNLKSKISSKHRKQRRRQTFRQPRELEMAVRQATWQLSSFASPSSVLRPKERLELLNPKVYFPLYADSDIQFWLQFIFVSSAATFLTAGILYWFFPPYAGIVIIIATVFGLLISYAPKFAGFLKAFAHARKYTPPAIDEPADLPGGIRAPSSSIYNGLTNTSSLLSMVGTSYLEINEGRLLSSRESIHDSRNKADADRITQALEPVTLPRRRHTFDSQADDNEEDPFRNHPSRTDTEANIGIPHLV